jgi:hypothetical protein
VNLEEEQHYRHHRLIFRLALAAMVLQAINAGLITYGLVIR